MKLLSLSVFLFAFISPILLPDVAAQNHPIEEQIFNQINQIAFTNDGKTVVLQNKSDFLIHILNEETFEVEKKLVRRGKGPGELPRASTFYLDNEHSIIYLAGFDKRVIGISISSGKILFEKVFGDLRSAVSPSDSPSMFIKNGYLFFTNRGSLSPSNPTDRPLPVVSVYDTSSTEVVFNFTLTTQQLFFPNLGDLEKTNRVPILSSLTILNERLSLVTFKGIPSFYFFVRGEFRQRIELETDFDISFITSVRKEFGSEPGIRTPSFINNIEKLNKEHVLISYGNIHQEEIPMGYTIFRIKHTPKPGLQDEIVVEKVFDKRLREIEGVSEFNIIPHQDKLFVHGNYNWISHQIYVVEDPELNNLLNK